MARKEGSRKGEEIRERAGDGAETEAREENRGAGEREGKGGEGKRR